MAVLFHTGSIRINRLKYYWKTNEVFNVHIITDLCFCSESSLKDIFVDSNLLLTRIERAMPVSTRISHYQARQF